jgi:hypothetical protein
MRTAFLFVEKSPNYDLDFQILRSIAAEDMSALEGYIRVGLWNLNEMQTRNKETRQNIIRNTLMTGDGNLLRISHQNCFDLLLKEQIYVFQFDSISRRLALAIDEKLKLLDEYLCFTQILSQNTIHQAIFNFLIPRYKLDKSKINVLFSSSQDDDECAADEIIDWVREKHSWLAVNLAKQDMGDRFSIWDVTANEMDELYVARIADFLEDEWRIHAERTLHVLQEIAPDALVELKLAIDKLSLSKLSSADCAQIGVSLRRCLEKVTDVISPSQSNNDREEYKKRLLKYIEKLIQTKDYNEYLQSDTTELWTRIDKLWIICNKAVHEDWSPQVFSLVTIRVILLLRELLLPLKNVKPPVYYDPGSFNLDRN